MNYLLSKMTFIFFALMLFFPAPGVSGQGNEPHAVEGVIRIRLEPELVKSPAGLSITMRKGIAVSGIDQIDRLNSDFAAYDMVRVFRYSPKFEEKHRKYGLHLWYDLYFSGKSSVHDVARSYAGIPGIERAEPVYRIELKDEAGEPVYAGAAVRTSDSGFDDPYLPDQWHYNNSGQTGGTVGADINLFKAWETTTGKSEIIISVHDMGIDVKHEDLAENIWVNEAELNGIKGIDDDGNGYRDDIYGFNFADNIGTVDANDHGTHVAGTIAAVNNNGIGVAGVAGGSGNHDGVKIMSCQILGSDGRNSQTPESFIYAADMGAVISQNSWGYESSEYYSQAVLDAIDYFIAEAGNNLMKGGVVIFAAGNNGWDHNSYPGAYEPVINVAALDHNNVKASYSNYGPNIDLCAPGGSGADGNKSMVLSTFPRNLYGFFEGTSMACPHVSGIAGLTLAANGGEGYTNKDLVNQLLTSAIEVDDLEGNSNYTGGLGAGAIDASLAVARDNGIAPDAINDFVLVGISQDFASVSWTVPNDGDDEKPVKFELLYSEEEFSGEAPGISKKIELRNSDVAGTAVTYEIQGLQSLTTFYFAIRSTDRWGNVSDLSNMVSGSTNEGPDAGVNQTAISMTVNVTSSTTGSDQFRILNNGEGLLKWNAVPRHVRNSDAYSIDVDYPELGELNVQKKIELTAREIRQNERIMPLNQEYINERMIYYDSWDGLYVVGETDLSLSNSSATRFKVKNEDGFNLTQVKAFLNQDPARGPFIIEIREGETLDRARLIYAKEANGWNYSMTTHYITLDEQIFFEKDASFWVIIHVPAGNLYPLGLGMELEKSQSDNCYMSLNMGKSWELLEDVWYDNRAVWAVEVVSNYRALDTYMTLTPSSGEVAAHDSTDVLAEVNASELINGTYTTNIVISTNDSEDKLIKVPVNITVTGHKPKLEVPEMVDFGSIIYGLEKELDISLVNTGLDLFRNPTVTISNPEFTQQGWLGSISARTEKTLTIRYKPSKPGTSNAKVTLKSSDGNSVSFVLVAVASEPPVAVISPADTLIGGLNIGDVVHGKFRISNAGKYPMKYYIPAYSKANLILNDPLIHKYGYSAEVDPALYNWEDISSKGKEISAFFDGTKYFKQVPIDFEFPFFGIEEDSIYITHRGIVSFDPNSVFNVSPVAFKNNYSPDRFISAWGHDFRMSEGGRIYYKGFDDHFVVQWEGVKHVYYDPFTWEEGFADVSFQIILYDNGDILIQYRNTGILSGMDIDAVFIGIEDQDMKDGLLVTDSYNNNVAITGGMAVAITNPGLGIFSDVTNTEGNVLSGETVDVDYTVETKRLTQNTFVERLSIVTNDPFNNPAYHTVVLDIVSGGASDVKLSTDTLDFGKVFQNGIRTMPFMISNDSTLDVSIVDARFANDKFTLSWGDVPATLKARHKLTYELSIISSTLGTINDVLTIETNEGELHTIILLGEIIEAPQISTDVTVINELLEAGDSAIIQVTVTNNGGNDLVFTPEGNEWLYLIDDGTGSDFSYTVVNSKSGNGPTFSWIDILETGVRDTLETFTANPEEFFAVVPLPYPFEFYGIKYDTMYIGGNGYITFNYELRDNIFFGPNFPIPHPEIPNNMIAPMFFFGGMGWFGSDPLTGYYHQVFDDKIVVTWQDMMNNFGMGEPVSFQAIIYRDGRIKFQYNMGSNDQSSQWGLAGIENVDGTVGISLYFKAMSYLKDKMAVMFSPANSYTIAPSESKVFNVKVDATDIFGGIYTDSLVLHTNVPGSEMYAIQATLTVIGSPELSAPVSIDLGEITVKEDPYMWPPYKAYEYEFELRNTGKAGFDINAMSVINNSGETRVNEWFLGSGWFGPEWGWYDVTDTWSVTYPQSIMPGTGLKMKAMVAPSGATEFISDTLVIECTGEIGTIRIPVEAHAVFPPALNKHTDKIELHAPDKSYMKDTIVVFDNINGQSDLVYTLRLDFGRVEATNVLPQMASIQTWQPVASGTEGIGELKTVPYESRGMENRTVAWGEPGYNRTLEYDTISEPDDILGYGGGTQFAAATRFKAPSDGFNLTHVKTWYTPDDWLSSRIIVEIRSGEDDINNSIVLASQVYEYTIPASDDKGEYLTIPLDNNIIFYPNESFYVAFYYPIAVEYPQGAATMDKIILNRYHYGNGLLWTDIARSNYKNSGWLMKALEFDHMSGAWVEITSEMEGQVPVGGSDTVQLHFDALFSEEGLNTAELVIVSNDGDDPESPVTLNLIRNRGPQFKDAPELILSVKEGSSITHTIRATDMESDVFTYELVNKPQYLTGVTTGKDFVITFAPDNDASSVYHFEVRANDVHNNASVLPVTIFVENVNRAPVLVAQPGDFFLYMDRGTQIMDLNGMFEDPDGDALTTTSTIADHAVAELFNASMRIAMNPLATGTSSVTIVAADPHGATAQGTVNVIVSATNAVGSSKVEGINIYPNPTSDYINVDLSDRREVTLVKLVDAKGTLIYENTPENEHLVIDLKEAGQGVYYLEIYAADNIYREAVLKL
jgi:subtilisin family serine protease